MRRKKTMIVVVLGIVLFGTARAAYGYWTDQIQIREEVALVWPVEVEIEEESTEVEGEESGSTNGTEIEQPETENPEGSGEHLLKEPET